MATPAEKDLEVRLIELRLKQPKTLDEALQVIKDYDRIVEGYKRLERPKQYDKPVGWG